MEVPKSNSIIFLLAPIHSETPNLLIPYVPFTEAFKDLAMQRQQDTSYVTFIFGGKKCCEIWNNNTWGWLDQWYVNGL